MKKIIYWFLDNREQNKNQETFNSEARPKGGNTRYNFFLRWQRNLHEFKDR